ncbi:MAG: EamA family transporter [Betaproteobacteria bacterium]|nr:EamA family transporter [Betaproteobacteria bacterium]
MSTTTLIVFLWAVTLATDTCGQLAFKAAAIENREAKGWEHWRHMLRRPWIYLGATAYIVEFVAWLAFLSTVTLSEGVLLGMAAVVTVMVGGRLWFKERFTRPRIIGVSLVLVGVALVGLGGMGA